MYDSTSDIDEDFFDALALLHSTEQNSAEKLRRMLDACIERKYGPEKTLAARMPKRFLRNVDESILLTQTSKRQKTGQSAKKSEFWDNDLEIISLLETNEAKNMGENIGNHRTFDIKVSEDCKDEEDIPRISIPDEGSADGIVCKICNGAKLGPLILLECQECQETYHPLCHQPPIIDVDVYDPRFVWRCNRCIETPSATPTRVKGTMEKGPVGIVRANSDTVSKEDANIAELKIPEKRDGDLFGKNGMNRHEYVLRRNNV
ncbi:integrator complex subunit 12-like [Pogonomyrmex barbatus]|uniref:Integrator complex subunit 12 n=1 Tax=Pogonomyrmex barbatus TaxID=144034 RepID=A0A6I9WNB6_9HYME|nr:integrator complex subunit 12-like [Pogonomyrmex barbatus]